MRTMPNRVRTRTGPARTALLLLPLAVAASAGCDLAMADYKQKETAEWRKTYELQPGGRVEISNVNGKIDVQPSSGNTVEIVAQKSARAASTEAAKQALERIEIQESESALRHPHRDEGAAQPGRLLRRREPAGPVRGAACPRARRSSSRR